MSNRRMPRISEANINMVIMENSKESFKKSVLYLGSSVIRLHMGFVSAAADCHRLHSCVHCWIGHLLKILTMLMLLIKMKAAARQMLLAGRSSQRRGPKVCMLEGNCWTLCVVEASRQKNLQGLVVSE